MAGIIVELIISWLLLWFFEKKHIGALGLVPDKKKLSQILIGFLIAGSICAIYHILTTAFIHNGWNLNPRFTFKQFLTGSWWTLKSAIFEELIFRGALLYIAIKRIGEVKASILSALCFGVYHWFSYGILGNPGQMIMVLVITGIAGWAFAWSFIKTGSIYVPIVLHFGWNLVHIIIFSSGPLGAQMLIKETNQTLQGTASLLVFLFQLLVLPVVVFFWLRSARKK